MGSGVVADFVVRAGIVRRRAGARLNETAKLPPPNGSCPREARLETQTAVRANRTAPSRRRGSSLGVAGIGRIYLWNGGSLWIGRNAGRGDLHRHHALQITLPLDGAVRLRTSGAEPWTDFEGAVVSSEQQHQFDGCERSVAQIFVEPETAAGAALLARCAGRPILALTRAQVAALAGPLFARFASTRADAPMIEAATTVLAAFAGSSEPSPRADARIVRVKALLKERVQSAPTLAELAASVHLSPSRLRHLFAAQARSSFRAYLLWLRLQKALAAFNRGGNWTQAAHAAGFADSAHLSRTFRRMFGVSPVMLVKE
jgi:AraC family transcriptional regulator